MAAPNIVNVTTINGKTAVADLGTTLTTTLLTAASTLEVTISYELIDDA